MTQLFQQHSRQLWTIMYGEQIMEVKLSILNSKLRSDRHIPTYLNF